MLLTGSLSEILGNVEDALFAYEQAIRANPGSTQAMNSISAILRTREDFPKAIEYLNQILKLDAANGEAWGSLGQLCPAPHQKKRSYINILARPCS